MVNDVVEPCVPPLSFDENGDFTILRLTDFHEWPGITPMAQAQSYDDAHSLMSGRIVKLNSNGNFSTFVFDSIDMQPDENARLIYNV